MFRKMISFGGIVALAEAVALLTASPGLAQRQPSGSTPQARFTPPDLVPAIRGSFPHGSSYINSAPYGSASSSYPSSTPYGRSSPPASSNNGWSSFYNYYPHYGEYRYGYPYYSYNYGYPLNQSSYGYSGSYVESYPEGTYPSGPPNRSANGYVPTGGSPLQFPRPTDDSARAAAAQPNRTTDITVNVPANAEVWFDESKMTSTGPVREYRTPLLAPKRRYTYEVRARWQENGREITQTQKVEISVGTHIDVTFPTPSGTEAGPGAKAR
jgi:uncharacterized protein (TIGR03000 family)